jgi:hypothetical protein
MPIGYQFHGYRCEKNYDTTTAFYIIDRYWCCEKGTLAASPLIIQFVYLSTHLSVTISAGLMQSQMSRSKFYYRMGSIV